MSGSIAGKGYFYIARNSASFTSLFQKQPDSIGTFALSNDGDWVKLFNFLSVEIDRVAWGNTPGWNINASDGHSIRRKNLTDTDSVTDWEVGKLW